MPRQSEAGSGSANPAGGPSGLPGRLTSGQQSAPKRITGIFLGVGLSWIWIVGRALVWMGIQSEAGFLLSAGSGTVLMLLSAVLVFRLMHRDVREKASADDLLRAVAEGTTDAVFVKDAKGRYLLFNQGASLLTGKPASEVLGRDDSFLFDPASAQRVMERDRQVMASGRASTSEEVLTADGVTRTYLATKAPYRDEKGNVVGLIGVSRDITDRKNAEESLRESQHRLEEAQRIARLGSWYWEPTTDRLWCSQTIHDLYGIGRSSVVPSFEAFLERVVPEDRAIARARVQTTLAGADSFANEFRVVHPDGRILWVNSVARATRDADGRLVRVEGFDQDVTERKRAEEALRASEERFRTLVDHGSDGIFLHDDTGTVVDANHRACESLGYTREDLIGKLPMAFDPTVTPEQLEGILAALARNEIVAFDTYHQRRDGSTFPVEVRIRPFWTEGRRFGLAVVRDISDRKRAEDELRRERDRLAKLAATAPGVLYSYRWKPDSPGRLTYASPAFADLFGSSLEELEKDPGKVLPRFYPEDVQRIRAARNESARMMTPCRLEFRVRHPSRGDIWVRVHSAPVREADGSIVWHGFILDVTDWRMAEHAVRESEERLRLAVETAVLGVIQFDLRTLTALLSSHAAEMLALPANQPVAVSILHSRFHPEDREEVERRIERSQDPAGPREFAMEHRALHPDGSVRWLSVRNRVFFEGSRPRRAIAVVADITDRRLAENALRESEARFRNLVEVLPDAIALVVGGKVVFCNPACLRLRGANDHGHILGKTPFDLLSPDSQDAFRNSLASMHATRTPLSGVENQVVRLDGQSVPVLILATPIPAYGEDAALLVLHDLSERKQIQKRLHHQEMMLREAAELAHVGGWSLDPQTRQITWTDEVARIHDLEPSVEYTMEETLGIYQGEDRGRMETALEGALRFGTPYDLELRLRTHRGVSKWVRTICRPQVEGGKVVQVRGSLQDITDRKLLEEKFQHAQKMEAIGRLAGGVAHDFNNLLTVINGYSEETLSTLPPGSPQCESIQAIREAGIRASRLTQQLLTFSRKAILERRLLDLNELVGDTVKMLRRLIGEDVILVVQSDPSLGLIRADPGQLEQVLMNLAINARDAMPLGGKLTLETRNVTLGPEAAMLHADLQPGRHAELLIRDTGQGMSEEVRRKIFEPFFTTKEAGKGTGLGLAVVHGVVKQCGGVILVESEVGAGTTFELLFPVEPGTLAAHPSLPAAPVPRGKETILLVEDEAAVRKIARVTLTAKGYKVLEAACGADALRLVENQPSPVHLLVTDVVMPGMGGRQLAETLRASCPTLRVLFMSGYTDDAVLQHGVIQARDAFLPKPFTPALLARKVREILDRSS